MYHTLLCVYRVRQTKEPEYLASVLNRDNYYGKIVVPNTRSTLFKRSFKVRGACNWNSLPLDIRQLRKVGTFKKELKTWIKREVSKFLD